MDDIDTARLKPGLRQRQRRISRPAISRATTQIDEATHETARTNTNREQRTLKKAA